jgi:hypothetical protein
MTISVSIDLKKLDKARFKPFKKKSGEEALYLELILIDHKSDYGDFFVKQSATKEEREQGVQLPILGNGKIVGGTKTNAPVPRMRAAAKTTHMPSAAESTADTDPYSDDAPF